jgi:hypothetical protein
MAATAAAPAVAPSASADRLAVASAVRPCPSGDAVWSVLVGSKPSETCSRCFDCGLYGLFLRNRHKPASRCGAVWLDGLTGLTPNYAQIWGSGVAGQGQNEIEPIVY